MMDLVKKLFDTPNVGDAPAAIRMASHCTCIALMDSLPLKKVAAADDLYMLDSETIRGMLGICFLVGWELKEATLRGDIRLPGVESPE